ncbi:IS110 family transposase [Floridanema aerugineum]|uniref:Transposase n=1 Tax=Floridaenema aerugineum BLCC-F46 TaxID=3153654 RepID=A0ABV4XHF6_9CYAN
MNLENQRKKKQDKVAFLLNLWRKFLTPGAEVFIGADVSKDNICIWVDSATNTPGKLKTYWDDVKDLLDEFGEVKRKYEALRLYANTEGAVILRHLAQTYKVQYIGMEPTGTNYSAVWVKICETEGIPIRWVGHIEVANFRKSNRLPNKNDAADAVAIYYYLLTYQNSEHYLTLDVKALCRIRQIYLQLGSLARIQSPIVNRLRQQLAVEFPEAALHSIKAGVQGFSPFAAWLAELPAERTTRYENLYSSSVAPQYEIEISSFTRRLASQQCDIHLWEGTLDAELSELLANPEFKKYNAAFDKLNFGLRTRAIVLAQIYPVEKFAKFNRITGDFNYTKSLAAFKQRLGYGGEQNASGDKDQRKAFGSKLSRKALYLWVVTKISAEERRPKIMSAEFKQLCEYYDTRVGKYNYNDWVTSQRNAAVKKAVAKLKAVLAPEVFALIEEQLPLLLETTDKPKPTPFEARRGYGSLCLSHTAARGVKQLFRLLTR